MAASKGKIRFLERVTESDSGRAAGEAFDRLATRPGAPGEPGEPALAGRIFASLVGHLLEWLALPTSKGAAHWEWAPLYGLERELDPHYFSKEQITDVLARCPPLSSVLGGEISAILARYLEWRAEGGLDSSSLPLLSGAECGRWEALFPSEYAWRSLDILRGAGLIPLGSPGGFRAWQRAEGGIFDPEQTASTLEEWRAECEAFAAEKGGTPHRYDFIAAAFAGEMEPLGLTGPCGEIPRCDECPLRKPCGWAGATATNTATSTAGNVAGNAEILAQARLGRMETLTSTALMQALFGNSGGAATIPWASLPPGHQGETSLRSLAGRSLPELEQWLGPSGQAPEKLAVLLELCRRFNDDRMAPGEIMRTGEDIFRHFRIRLRDVYQEHFYLVMLDVKRRFLAEADISRGTLDRTLVHPREVFSAAIRGRAASIVMVHNHPSGDPAPSRDDINVTKRLADAGAVIGIPLVDHVILGDERYFSMAENGLMKF